MKITDTDIDRHGDVVDVYELAPMQRRTIVVASTFTADPLVDTRGVTHG
jgi:hypothetical protein